MLQTEKEAAEYEMMEKRVTYHEPSGEFHVSYPWIDNPAKLGNNFHQVAKMAEREEDNLERDGLTEEGNAVFQKMVDYGALRELPQLERDHWSGPIHYISIQHVRDPSSSTTPLRLVTNTSL